jgi:drug/metabolite transporter (DMT)-like permease
MFLAKMFFQLTETSLVVLAFTLFALFASVFTIAKTGLDYSQPIFFVGSRMFMAGILLISYQFIFHRKQCVIARKDLWRILRLGAFNIYLTNIFEFWGLQYLTSFKTCFIYSLSPFLSALFSFFIFSEKMSGKKWLGLIIGFGGIMPMLLSQTTVEERAGELFLFSWAELAVMGAAICSVYGWILLKQLVNENGYTPILANGASMLIGGALALCHSFFVEDWTPVPVSSYFPFLICALLLIVISNLICYNLYGVLLKKFSATFISFAGLSTPVFSAFFGWLFLQEQPTWTFYISLLIVYGGLYIFYQEELQTSEVQATVSST